MKILRVYWGDILSKQTFSYLAFNDFNTLPSAIKDTDSLGTFKLHFK